MIKVFSGFLKYVALMAISDFVHMDYKDPEVDRLLAGSVFQRPPLGEWNRILRTILAFHKRNRSQPSIEGLLAFYFHDDKQKPNQTENVKVIDRFITLRNEYVHPDIFPPREESERLLGVYHPLLDQLLDASPFLTEYRLTLQIGGQYFPCCGPDLGAVRKTEIPEGEDCSFLLERPGQESLSFLVFLLFDRPSTRPMATGDQLRDVMIYESRTRSRVQYVRGNVRSYTSLQDFLDKGRFLNRIKEQFGQEEEQRDLKRRRQNVESPSWERLQQYCREESFTMVAFHEREKKYRRDFYLRRKEPEETFAAFIHGAERLCIFVGDSGCGKTNLFCHLTDEYVDQKEHCVLHYYGRNYDGGSLLSAIASDLVVEEDQLLPFLAAFNHAPPVKDGKRLILFFDAINEYDKPIELYGKILSLVDILDKEIGYHKLVVSMRTATWRILRRACDSFERGKVFLDIGT